MLTVDQVREIEMVAMKGKAVASLLGLSSSLEECTTEDIGLSVYALECYFVEILNTLEGENTSRG
jgi:hypothetical protein